MYAFNYKDELYHHGVLGMKWGKRNGPPYPLSDSAHSSSEKKAGWKKSLDKPHLSDKQKRIIKGVVIGALAAGAIAGSVYLAKSGALTPLAEYGKSIYKKIPNEVIQTPISGIKNYAGSKEPINIPNDIAKKFGKFDGNFDKDPNPYVKIGTAPVKQSNCGQLASTKCIRDNFKINIIAQNGPASKWEDYEEVFIGSNHKTVPKNVDSIKALQDHLISSQNDGDNGMVLLREKSNYNDGPNGFIITSKVNEQNINHFINYSVSNGISTLSDDQFALPINGKVAAKGISISSDGSVTIGGKKLNEKQSALMIDMYFRNYAIEATDYMKVNGSELTDNVDKLNKIGIKPNSK